MSHRSHTIEVVYDWSIRKWKIQTYKDDKFIAVDSFMDQKDAIVNALVDYWQYEKEHGTTPHLKMFEKSGAIARFDTPHTWRKIARERFEELQNGI